MKNGSYKPSYVSQLLKEKALESFTEEEEHVIKWSAASLYGGGADTVGTLYSNILFRTNSQ
jgi:hypothetical protein